jgi:excisionase family DNA binding protein
MGDDTDQGITRRTYNLWPDAGHRLGLSRTATYAAAKRGDIPTIKIGGRFLVPKVAFDRLVDGAAQ